MSIVKDPRIFSTDGARPAERGVDNTVRIAKLERMGGGPSGGAGGGGPLAGDVTGPFSTTVVVGSLTSTPKFLRMGIGVAAHASRELDVEAATGDVTVRINAVASANQVLEFATGASPGGSLKWQFYNGTTNNLNVRDAANSRTLQSWLSSGQSYFGHHPGVNTSAVVLGPDSGTWVSTGAGYYGRITQDYAGGSGFSGGVAGRLLANDYIITSDVENGGGAGAGFTTWAGFGHVLNRTPYFNGLGTSLGFQSTQIVSEIFSTTAVTASPNGVTNSGGLVKVTSTGHGMVTGDSVQLAGTTGGPAGVNSIWKVTVIDADNFTLDGSVWSGSAGGGGTALRCGYHEATGVAAFMTSSSAGASTRAAELDVLSTKPGRNLGVMISMTRSSAGDYSTYNNTGVFGAGSPWLKMGDTALRIQNSSSGTTMGTGLWINAVGGSLIQRPICVTQDAATNIPGTPIFTVDQKGSVGIRTPTDMTTNASGYLGALNLGYDSTGAAATSRTHGIFWAGDSYLFRSASQTLDYQGDPTLTDQDPVLGIRATAGGTATLAFKVGATRRFSFVKTATTEDLQLIDTRDAPTGSAGMTWKWTGDNVTDGNKFFYEYYVSAATDRVKNMALNGVLTATNITGGLGAFNLGMDVLQVSAQVNNTTAGNGASVGAVGIDCVITETPHADNEASYLRPFVRDDTTTGDPHPRIWGIDSGVYGTTSAEQQRGLQNAVFLIGNYYNGSPSHGPSAGVTVATAYGVGVGTTGSHLTTRTRTVDYAYNACGFAGDSNGISHANAEIAFRAAFKAGGTGIWLSTSGWAHTDQKSRIGIGFEAMHYETAGLKIHRRSTIGATSPPAISIGWDNTGAASTVSMDGIDFGGDVVLYRSAASTLRTEDIFSMGLNAASVGAVTPFATMGLDSAGSTGSYAITASGGVRGLRVLGGYSVTGEPAAQSFMGVEVNAALTLGATGAGDDLNETRGISVTLAHGMTASKTYGNVAATSEVGAAYRAVMNFTTAASSTATHAGTVAGFSSAASSIDTGWTVSLYAGFRVSAPSGAGTITALTGLDVQDLNAYDSGSGTTTNLAMGVRTVSPILITDTESTTSSPRTIQSNSANVALEVDSTTRAILLPRMTSTQRDAMTAIDGMLIYNSTIPAVQARVGGAWTSL